MVNLSRVYFILMKAGSGNARMVPVVYSQDDSQDDSHINCIKSVCASFQPTIIGNSLDLGIVMLPVGSDTRNLNEPHVDQLTTCVDVPELDYI